MKPRQEQHLRTAGISHPGSSGKNNEDRYGLFTHDLSQSDPTPSTLAILADGIGGHQAGEIAAEIAVDTIGSIVGESDASNPLDILNQAVVQAGQNIADQALSDDNQMGMGSTCACAWIIKDKLYISSVGDSRIYFIRDGLIRQLTLDHTWVQEAISHGIIDPSQARNHPKAHVIQRYLGSRSPVAPDFRLFLKPNDTDQQALANQGFSLLPKDRLLLCSDGLTDLVDDHEILETLLKETDEQAVQTLVDLANKRGGHDNITIMTLHMPPLIKKGMRKRSKTSAQKGNFRWYFYLIFSILLLVLTALGTMMIINFFQ